MEGARSASQAASIWQRVEELVDRAPSVEVLRAHRLHLAAARIWRARGLAIPDQLAAAERRAAGFMLAAQVLLERCRAAYDGQLMLMKGPEAAAWYRHPSDRCFRDLDLLADDAPAAQRALLAAGFREVGNADAYTGAQHLCPLIWPGIPLIIELHRHPNLPAWLPRPSASAILAEAVPSMTGITGLDAPDPAAHTLLLVGHGWAHRPLGRLGDLLDVAAILEGAGRVRTSKLATTWGWEGIWRISLEATDAVLAGRGRPLALDIWARHLSRVRDRTVLENHIAQVVAPACALPARRVPAAMAGVLRGTAARRDDEHWTHKLRRSRLAVAHALMPTSSHEQTLPPITWPDENPSEP